MTASAGDPVATDAMTREHLDCADALQIAYLYLDGELRADEMAAARTHLDDCVRCLREYGLEEEVKRLVRRACGCDDVPVDLRQKVLIRLRQVTIDIRFDAR